MTQPTDAEIRACVTDCTHALQKVEQWTANLHANLNNAVTLLSRMTGGDYSTESGGTNKPPPPPS